MRALILRITLASLAVVCAVAQAQKVIERAPETTHEKVIQPLNRPIPFDIDSKAPGKSPAVEFRSVDQMTEPDRLQAANAESSIAEHAGRTGLEFNEGQWTYRQVVCAALPNHIFLRFLRNNGAGDVSVFTASIPRGDEGRVRIIPIQQRGYSLFSPAPINAITITTFNHIRAEENPDGTPVADWLGTAFCYAALAGGHPQAAVVNQEPPTGKFSLAEKARLAIPSEGGAVISFTDVSTAPRSLTWTMIFNGKGKLLKASRAPATLVAINWIHPAKLDPKTRQILQLDPPEKSTPVPPAPLKVIEHPIAPEAPALTSAQPAGSQ